MYSFIKGCLNLVDSDSVVLETSGVGYLIYISAKTKQELPAIGEVIQLHTSFIVRENAQALYGFFLKEERGLFELLLSISGVGPKLALSLLGHLSCFELEQAVMSHNLKRLCEVPGVGKKTAERLVIELKDKLSDYLPKERFVSCQNPAPTSSAQDAILALIHLGYQQGLAKRAVQETLSECSEEIELPLLITAALKNIKALI